MVQEYSRDFYVPALHAGVEGDDPPTDDGFNFRAAAVTAVATEPATEATKPVSSDWSA